MLSGCGIDVMSVYSQRMDWRWTIRRIQRPVCRSIAELDVGGEPINTGSQSQGAGFPESSEWGGKLPGDGKRE
jgi:hypothetical protein